MGPPTVKQFLLPEDLQKDLLTYLQERPFKEVATGIARLMSLQEAPQAPAAAEEKKKG